MNIDVEILEKVMGYTHLVGDEVPEDYRDSGARGEQEIWLNENNSKGGYYCKWCGNVPRFSSDLNAAHEVEEKIKEMGLELEYVFELIKIFNINSLVVKADDFFNIAHASASDRCRSALMAVEGKR